MSFDRGREQKGICLHIREAMIIKINRIIQILHGIPCRKLGAIPTQDRYCNNGAVFQKIGNNS